MQTDPAGPRKPRQRASTRKTDRQSFRLGGGEYELPPELVKISVLGIYGEGEAPRITPDRGERASLQRGRRLFFAACGQVRPEFVEDLNAAPKAAVQTLGQRAQEPARVSALLGERGALVGRLGLVDKLRYIERPWPLVKLDDRYRQVREALEAWAKRFNLRDDWLMNLALHHSCPPPWDDQVLFLFPAVKTDRKLSLISSDPTVETREHARMRMHGLTEQHLGEIEKQAATRGLEPTPERRQPRHFHWLAGYQIWGWSQNRIAKAAGTDRAGVGRAIHDLADFLGLTVRAAKPNDPAQTVDAIRAALRRLPSRT